MIDLHLVNVVLHVSAGVLALLTGAVPLLTRKGGPVHRRAGRVFAWIGAVVLVTAAIGDVFFHSPPALVAASVAAGYGYLSSLRALALRSRGPGWVDAALAVAGLGACVLLWILMGPGTASWTPAIGYSTIGYVAALAVYDLSRFAWSDAWLRHARPLDHGLKMTGAYFAMMSAGVGNLVRAWQPWSQVGPTILGFIVMIVLTIVFVVGRRRQGRAAVEARLEPPLSRSTIGSRPATKLVTRVRRSPDHRVGGRIGRRGGARRDLDGE